MVMLMILKKHDIGYPRVFIEETDIEFMMFH